MTDTDAYSTLSAEPSAAVVADLHRVGEVALVLGVFGLFCCVITAAGGVVLTLGSLQNDRPGSIEYLGIAWLWVGQAAATYFCWYATRVRPRMRLGSKHGSATHYAAAFECLRRMLLGLSAAILYLLVSAIYAM